MLKGKTKPYTKLQEQIKRMSAYAFQQIIDTSCLMHIWKTFQLQTNIIFYVQEIYQPERFYIVRKSTRVSYGNIEMHRSSARDQKKRTTWRYSQNEPSSILMDWKRTTAHAPHQSCTSGILDIEKQCQHTPRQCASRCLLLHL